MPSYITAVGIFACYTEPHTVKFERKHKAPLTALVVTRTTTPSCSAPVWLMFLIFHTEHNRILRKCGKFDFDAV